MGVLGGGCVVPGTSTAASNEQPQSELPKVLIAIVWKNFRVTKECMWISSCAFFIPVGIRDGVLPGELVVVEEPEGDIRNTHREVA